MEVPASISTADLTNMLNDAPSDEDQVGCTCTCNHSNELYDGLTQFQLEELVNDCAQELYNKCNDPLAHKVLILFCLNSLTEFHNTVSEKTYKEGSPEQAQAWAIDQGRLHSAYQIIREVEIGSNDFTTSSYDYE